MNPSLSPVAADVRRLSPFCSSVRSGQFLETNVPPPPLLEEGGWGRPRPAKRPVSCSAPPGDYIRRNSGFICWGRQNMIKKIRHSVLPVLPVVFGLTACGPWSPEEYAKQRIPVQIQK